MFFTFLVNKAFKCENFDFCKHFQNFSKMEKLKFLSENGDSTCEVAGSTTARWANLPSKPSQRIRNPLHLHLAEWRWFRAWHVSQSCTKNRLTDKWLSIRWDESLIWFHKYVNCHHLPNTVCWDIWQNALCSGCDKSQRRWREFWPFRTCRFFDPLQRGIYYREGWHLSPATRQTWTSQRGRKSWSRS